MLQYQMYNTISPNILIRGQVPFNLTEINVLEFCAHTIIILFSITTLFHSVYHSIPI